MRFTTFAASTIALLLVLTGRSSESIAQTPPPWVEVVTTYMLGGGDYPCGDEPCARGQFPPASWRPYGSASAFNRTVNYPPTLIATSVCGVANVPPNSTCSAEIINRMLGDISASKQPANMVTPQDGTGGWPTYYGTNSDLLYRITCNQFACSSVEGVLVHTPYGALVQGNNPNQDRTCTDPNPANCGPDRHLTIIDQTNHKEFDLWHVQLSPLPNASNVIIPTGGSGYTVFDSGDGLAIGQAEGNAGRFGNIAGRVRIEELNDAVNRKSFINHAITVAIDCTSGQDVYPASTNSGRACDRIQKSNVNAPPMGGRIHLNMKTGSVAGDLGQINGLAIPEWKKVFLRTLIVYGAIINDTGSSFYFDWQVESGNQYTAMSGRVPPDGDPWWAFGQSRALEPNSDWFSDGAGGWKGLWQSDPGVDWSAVWTKLEVLDECVSRGTC